MKSFFRSHRRTSSGFDPFNPYDIGRVRMAKNQAPFTPDHYSAYDVYQSFNTPNQSSEAHTCLLPTIRYYEKESKINRYISDTPSPGSTLVTPEKTGFLSLRKRRATPKFRNSSILDIDDAATITSRSSRTKRNKINSLFQTWRSKRKAPRNNDTYESVMQLF